jgi:hypothetical protein
LASASSSNVVGSESPLSLRIAWVERYQSLLVLVSVYFCDVCGARGGIPRQPHRPVEEDRSQHQQGHIGHEGTAILEEDARDRWQQGESQGR